MRANFVETWLNLKSRTKKWLHSAVHMQRPANFHQVDELYKEDKILPTKSHVCSYSLS
jgi:hypothetical protein